MGKANTTDHSIPNQVDELLELIHTLLPNSSENSPKFWSDGSEILTKTVEQATVIADFLETLGCEPLNTGFFNPIEDERNNEVDEFTGYYYVTV